MISLINDSLGTLPGLVRLVLGELQYLSGRLNGFLQPDFRSRKRLVFVYLGNINCSPFAKSSQHPLA